MKQAMIYTENDINRNPLFRKMRDRFMLDGSKTIGEIMLYRAKKDRYANAQTPVDDSLPVSPSATDSERCNALPDEKKAKKSKAMPQTEQTENYFKKFVKSHHVAITCLSLTLCTVILLAFMVPFLANLPLFGDKASAATPTDATPVSVASTEDIPDQTEAKVSVDSTEVKPTFNNVMDAFSYSFGN
jgi:hypothetical protein